MLTELTPASEHVTAVLTSHLATGENFDGAITIGIYPRSQGEIWMQAAGARFNIQCHDIPDLVKQLKRAAKLASEQSEEG